METCKGRKSTRQWVIRFVSKEEIAELTSFLDTKWSNTKPVPGTHHVHRVKSHGSDRVQVSDTTDGGKARVCVIRKSMWLGTSAVSSSGCWEQVHRRRAKNAWQHSGAVIIKKKRFVPENLYLCTCSCEGEVCAWTAIKYGCGPWARVFMHVLQ